MNLTQPGTHLDHLMRQTRWHHMQLSAMADAKANMMLTIPSVVITLLIRYLSDPGFRWAALTLIGFCLATLLLAAYAAAPKIGAPRHAPPPDVNSPTFNLLYFGDFTRLDYAAYERAMETMMNDPNAVYESQVRELYTLGSYLAAKKYRFIRWAYICFIAGFLSAGIVQLASWLCRG